jgi:ectoine hydroxylase-related dioxygenase (phytanoyl-CoA dioxygenase family)
VHLPLVDVSLQMGPTIFCPSSHGLAQKGKAGWTSGVERALTSWYLTPKSRCAEDPTLSYTRPLKIGQLTLYDANVFHGGTANHAGVPRPVLQLSYSMSPAATAARDYLKGTFSANGDAKKLAEESSTAFQTSFRALE